MIREFFHFIHFFIGPFERGGWEGVNEKGGGRREEFGLVGWLNDQRGRKSNEGNNVK